MARSACGAPITAYNRISNQRCNIHSNIYEPDYVVVVDEAPHRVRGRDRGLEPESGAIIINTRKTPEEIRPLLGGYAGRVCTIDANGISKEILGKVFPQHPHAGRNR